MSIRSTLINNAANSINSALNSAWNLAGNIIEYKGKEKQKQESENRLFKSNQDVLMTAYQKGVLEIYNSLPEDILPEQYNARIEDYNSKFISDTKNSGLYNDRILAWLENEYIPSQQPQNDNAVAITGNFANNTQVAGNAISKGDALAADPSLGVDEASAQYRNYYNDTGLGGIENGPNEYGYLTPDEYTEYIRETKTIQAFDRIAKERFGYDTSWDVNEALEEAMAETGYRPNAEKKIALKQKADSALNQYIDDIKKSVNMDVVNFTSDVNNFITNGQYYDTALLDEAIASYPVAYASPLMELKITVEKSNETIVYNMVATGSLGLSDETLSCLAESSDYRAKLISDDITKRAQSMFNSGTQIRDVMAWIKNGNLGYTATAQERDAIASKVLDWAKNQKKSQEEMDEIDTFYFVENPQLVGDTAAVSYVDSPIFVDNTMENLASDLGLETGKGNIDIFEDFPEAQNEDGSVSTVRTISVGIDGKEVLIPTTWDGENHTNEEAIQRYRETGLNFGTFDSVSEADSYAENLHKLEEAKVEKRSKEAQEATEGNAADTIAPQTTYQVNLGTTNAQNKAQQTQTQQSMIASIDDQNTYNQLFDMKYVECLPDDVIKAKVKQAYDAGLLTKETAETLAKDFVFGENDTWQNLIGTVNETIDMLMPNAGYQERKNAKRRIYSALVSSMGANWHLLDDEAVLNSAMNMIANDVMASSWLGNAESYSKASDDPQGYLKALTKASYKDLRDAISDGSIMPFINVVAQNDYLAGNPQANGSVDDAREFFTTALGLGTKYEDLGNDLDRLIVEYNVAYSQFRGDIRSLFVDTFKDYMDTGVSEMLWVDTEIGGTFAFSDSENRNLYFFPDVNTIRKVDGRLEATWFYAYDTDGNGGPDTEPVKFTDLAGIISDISGYREKEQAKAERNAEMSQNLGEFAQSLSESASEFEAEAFNEDNNLLIRSYMLGESNKQNQLLTIVNAIGSFFGINKGKYDSEDELIRETLDSIR